MRAIAAQVRALLTTLAASLLLLAVSGGAPAHAASRSVTMSDYAFGPASLTVTVGDTVTWTNQDTAPHNVKTTSAPVALDSPMLDKGGTWSYTFTVPGTYHYYCTVHPDMTATLVVGPAPTTAPPAAPTTHPAAAPTTAAAVPAPSTPAGAAAPLDSSTTPTASVPSRSSAPATAPTMTGMTQDPAPAPVQVAATTTSDSRPLQPLLLLTGVVSAVAVLCLLLVGSRAQQRHGN